MMGAGLSLDEAQEFMKDFIIRRGRLGVRLALLSLGKMTQDLVQEPACCMQSFDDYMFRARKYFKVLPQF